MKLESFNADLDHLDKAAKSIIDICGDHTFLAIYGEMGAGKTTLIQAIGKELGVLDTISSPTFSLVNEYKIEGSNGGLVYHFDFYRIEKLEEVYDIGYEEYFYSDHYCLVEWPDRVKSLLPDNHIEIRISRIAPIAIGGNDNIREITIFKH